MKSIALFLTVCAALAQTPQVQLSFSTGSAVKIGFPGARDVVITSGAGVAPQSLQFTVVWPATLTGVSFSAAAASTAAGKALTCGTIVTNPDTTLAETCVVAGLNKNAIGNGPIATMNFTVAKTAAVGNSQQLSLANTTVSKIGGTTAVDPTPLAADVTAVLLAATGGTTVIPFVSPADLNGDGKVDAADLLIMTQQILGLAPCGSGDLNGDGRCDVADAELLILAALGQ